MAHFAVHIPVDAGILSFGAAMLDGISARDYNVSIKVNAGGSAMNIRRITCIYVVMLVLQWIFGIAPHQSKMVDDYGGQIRVASEGQPLENMYHDRDCEFI